MAQIVYLPKPIPLSTVGGLLAGAKLYTYTTATSTPQSVYQDYALTTPHANPVVADANGVFPVMYWGNTARYRLTLKTSADVTLSGYPVDDCGPETSTGLGVPSLSGNNTMTGAWNKFQSTDSRIILDDSDGGTDKRLVDLDHNGGVTTLRTRTDADGSGKAILTATQGTGTEISTIVYGNDTDRPAHTFYGAVSGSSIPIIDYLTANESSSSTTLANSGLSIALGYSPYATYAFELHAAITGGAGGIAFNINYSDAFTASGVSHVGGIAVYNGTGSTLVAKDLASVATTASFTTATLGSTNPQDFIHLHGVIKVVNAANLSFAYGLNSASGSVTLRQGSWLKVTPLGA